MKKISFVIPCYGSQKTISAVVDEILATVKKQKRFKYEIILINDGSPDRVYEEIIRLCKRNKSVKAVNLTKNFGQQSALMAGQAQVTGDIVVCLDDDGQSPVNRVFEMIKKLEEGYDVIFAKYGIKKQTLVKNFGSWLNTKMAEFLLNKPKGVSFASFFVMRRYVSDEMIKYSNPFPYNIGLILSVTRNIGNFECVDRQRLQGKSGYTFARLLALWLDGFTNFSVKPLRLATVLGVISGTFGLGFGIYTIIVKLNNPAIQAGYSGIISAVTFIGGIILLVLGMIGEYVGRIFISLNKIPQYVIKEKINID